MPPPHTGGRPSGFVLLTTHTHTYYTHPAQTPCLPPPPCPIRALPVPSPCPLRTFFVHLCLLGALFAFETPVLVLPLGGVLGLFWFFPRAVGAIFGALSLWLLLLPLVQYLRQLAREVLEKPYGSNDGAPPPEKVRNGAHAVELALAEGATHYEALNAIRTMTPVELKGCYKRMALLLHPDKNHDESAPSAFKRVTEAWDALGDVYRRADYDAELDGAFEMPADEGGADEANEANERSAADTLPEGPPGLKKRRPRKAPR